MKYESQPAFSLPAVKMGWLLLCLLAVMAPHATRVPLTVTVFSLALLVWRFLASKRAWRSPGRLPRMLLVAAGLAIVFADYRTLLGRDAGVAVLVVMLSLKLLELRSVRDVMLLVFLAYFLIITNFLYSQSIFLAAYMFLAVLMLTAALGMNNHSAPRLHLKLRLREAAVLLVQAIPIMLILFVLFPRLSGPLWKLPRDAFTGQSGLSEQMKPGDIGRLGLSHAVAFRVDFESDPPDPRLLYWRGPAFWDFDGQTWSGSALRPRALERRFVKESSIAYTVTLEPHNRTWLFALDLPVRGPDRSFISEDRQLLAQTPIQQRLRYRAMSLLAQVDATRPTVRERIRALDLPPQANPRAVALGARLREEHPGPMERVQAVLRMFREQPFEYTLTPARLGTHPVDDFLFVTRSGFCEHYASAFAVVMRAAGIPSRVVTGYQGGEYNELGDYLIVRQSDAHAWNEAWLDGHGWLRIDPTAAVAPERVDRGIEAALPEELAESGLVRGGSALFRQAVLVWDSLNNGWNKWVLGYSTQRQRDLLAGLGLKWAEWKALALYLSVGVPAVLTLLYLSMRRRGTANPDRVQAIYLRFCRKLARHGIDRRASEGPLQFAERVASTRPDLAPAVQSITDLYIALRYGTERRPDRLRELQGEVAVFSVPRAANKEK